MTYLVLDLETEVDPAFDDLWRDPEKPDKFPPPYACRVLTAGVAILDFTKPEIVEAIGVVAPTGDEAAKIARLFAILVQRKPIVTSWNGRKFDLPVLTLRGLSHGLIYPDFSDACYRYTAKRHLDLMDALSMYGAAPFTSLGAMARLLGLPPKAGDGKNVSAMSAEERDRYCAHDVALTCMGLVSVLRLRGVELREDAEASLLNAFAADKRIGDLWKQP